MALKDLETELKDKFREGIAKGMDLGCEQGYNVAKEAFNEVVKVANIRKMCTFLISICQPFSTFLHTLQYFLIIYKT